MRTPSNPFHGKVDMDRIAIIGHSRGGEAVGHAAAFNQLEYYPDDASVKFDFHFHIRSVIAIAPVDGQYEPTDRLVPIHDVNYLVFAGSHDGDVPRSSACASCDRLRFTDTRATFKAAVYVYRANHGQWNTVWSAHDNGPRSARMLDLRDLLPAKDQREFAKIYISAFLDATLKDDKRYLPIFRDHRVIGHWLPKTMYVTRFETSAFRPAGHVPGGHRRHPRHRARRDAPGRQPEHLEGGDAAAALAEHHAGEQRRLAGLEQQGPG